MILILKKILPIQCSNSLTLYYKMNFFPSSHWIYLLIQKIEGKIRILIMPFYNIWISFTYPKCKTNKTRYY